MSEQNQLSNEDQLRVERYLSSVQHGDDNQLFRPWLLLLVIWVVLLVLGGLSYAIALGHGVV
jgi:hypothetical protein